MRVSLDSIAFLQLVCYAGVRTEANEERYRTMYIIEIHYTKYVVKFNGKLIGETTEYHKALDLCTNLSVKVKTVVVKGN